MLPLKFHINLVRMYSVSATWGRIKYLCTALCPLPPKKTLSESEQLGWSGGLLGKRCIALPGDGSGMRTTRNLAGVFITGPMAVRSQIMLTRQPPSLPPSLPQFPRTARSRPPPAPNESPTRPFYRTHSDRFAVHRFRDEKRVTTAGLRRRESGSRSGTYTGTPAH